MQITCVVGARPNFMKVAPILEAAARRSDVECRLVHTGQHYDTHMSALFFEELGLPKPDVYLGVGSSGHAEQTARVMIAFDEVVATHPTEMVLVVGDVNSTLACALVAAKRGIPVAHVEAGLRSRDRRMPEEINRVLTDQISDYLFTTEPEANQNLEAEGIPSERIFFVGNVMIDTLLAHREKARRHSDILHRLGQTPRQYAVCTLHRPANVDTHAAAENTLRALTLLAERLPVVWPMHPRTRARLEEFDLLNRLLDRPNLRVIEPLGYLDFLALIDQARLVCTDSGGVQEETTVLGVPCFTFRENTERPITVTQGTNRLVGVSPEHLANAVDALLAGDLPKGRVPELWDGRAAERILSILCDRGADAAGSRAPQKAVFGGRADHAASR